MVAPKRFRILVVDDDLDTLQLVGTTLEKQGYEIVAAKDGIEALEKVDQVSPDLILLDLMMPRMDGTEVTRRLRANPETANIPIIMFTARAQVDDKVAGLEAGADEYLTKPTHPAELVARVRNILKRPTGMLPELPPEEDSKHGVFGVLAAKGGQGVTTLSINLGAALLEKNPKDSIIVAEMRPGRGDLSTYMGYINSQGLNDLLRMEARKINKEVVARALETARSGIKLLLASNRPSDGELITKADQMATIARLLGELGSYAVLDLGCNLPEGMQRVLRECDRILVLAEPDHHTMQQTRAMLDDLKEMGYEDRLACAMVSRIRTDQVMSPADVQKALGTTLDVVFTPAPELAFQAANMSQSMVTMDKNSFTAQQTAKLADLLTRTSVPA